MTILDKVKSLVAMDGYWSTQARAEFLGCCADGGIGVLGLVGEGCMRGR